MFRAKNTVLVRIELNLSAGSHIADDNCISVHTN